jgi:hypothetical protein
LFLEDAPLLFTLVNGSDCIDFEEVEDDDDDDDDEEEETDKEEETDNDIGTRFGDGFH